MIAIRIPLSILALLSFTVTPFSEGHSEMKDKRTAKPVPTYATDVEGMEAMILQRSEEMRATPSSFPEGVELAPPWIIIPDFPMASMAWRMGGGEDYWHRFDRFFLELDAEERIAYRGKHPEPEGWNGFYQLLVDSSKM